MKNLALLIFFIFLAHTGKSQIDPALANQLQNVLNNSVSNSGNNGVSAHLRMPNGQTWSGTAGVGHQNLPVTDSTLFHGASTTKLNIASLLLLLAEDSLVDLDETWNHYVSLNAGFDTSITVRQLLNHTSGIADYLETPSSGNDITSNFNNFFTPRNILEDIVSDVPDFAAGTNFQYSNSNYALAALIAETVTGNPVQTELRNRIWTPLGMDHTYFGAYESYTEPLAGVWWDFGSGVTNYSNVPKTSMLSYAYGAGNIVTCPQDLAILLSSILNGQLIDTGSLTEMMDFVPDSYSSWTAGYGLGIHHYSQPNDDVIGHDGYYTNLTDMFHSMNCGFTLVTMTNTQTFWFGIFSPMYSILTNYCNATDIFELESEVGLTISPNPAQNKLRITCEQIIDEIEILDAAGKVCYSVSPFKKEASLVLEANGLFFVRVKSNGQLLSKKLILTN